MRRILSLNDTWKFSKNNSDFETVNLPHTWNAVDGQDGGNDYYRGECKYEKAFAKPQLHDDERVFLEVTGAAMTARVFLNGRKIGTHCGGYSTFRFDITDSLQGKNILEIYVDNGNNTTVYPQMADFTFYGGLYRGVNLVITSKQHFELVKDGTYGIMVTPNIEFLTEDIANANVVCKAFVDGGENENLSVRFTVLQTGEMVETSVVGTQAQGTILIENVHLWNGVKDSFLYQLKAELIYDGCVVDEVDTRFGCRTVSADSQHGFLLNGKPYRIMGVSRHQDWEGVGNALTIDMHRKDIELICEMGATAVRLAHYQHAQEFYDLCDEKGLLVWAEIPCISAFMENGRDNTLQQMRELVCQCYNHASIYCWGLSNEITAASEVSEAMLENMEELNNLCHILDSTRMTTMAHISMLESDSPLIPISDIASYNIYFGWYSGELGDNEKFLDAYHDKFPDRCIGLSEYGADTNIAYHSATPKKGDYSEEYQTLYHEHMINTIMERPWLTSSYAWNMFDFAADGRDDGGIPGRNLKGLVTFDRKIKKDAFYLYKAYWSDEPFVHICGSRYINRLGNKTEIKVYSNQDNVILYVDTEQVGQLSGDKIFRFQIDISNTHTILAVSGECKDEIMISKVAEPDKSYVYEKKIVNWFDQDAINPNYYSAFDTVDELAKNPECANILNTKMGRPGDVPLTDNAKRMKMLGHMTIADIMKRSGRENPKEAVKEFNDILQRIAKNS